MADFKQEHLENAPPWLRDPVGETFLRTQGDAKDALVARAHASVRARFIGIAPEDALAQVGIERQMDRGPSEPTEAYAARLIGGWETWPFAGTATGVLNALWDAGYTNHPVIVSQRGYRYQLDANRALVRTPPPAGRFTFEAPNFWNTFLLVFRDPLPPAWVSGGVPADGSTEAEAMIALVNKWKSAVAKFAGVIVIEDGRLWDYPQDLTWDEWELSGETWDTSGGVVWTP